MENFDKIKGIIFDYGGTIDSRGVHWSEVIYDGYLTAEADVDKAAFRDAYVEAERELARHRHILPHHNFYDLLLIKMKLELGYLVNTGHLTQERANALAEPIARYCYEAARSSVEEARPVLEQLSKKYPMVLVSNFYGNVEAVLKDFDLEKYFKDIIESAVVGVRKPDPAIFALGVKALDLSADEVLVVGDSYKKDILPALSIGCKVLWLKGKGWTAEEDAVTHPSAISHLNDVLVALA
ncbi:MAG: HAD family hydrolase [Lachnoclostridium sp.]|nr:HAD family hydrolase [Lachnoclostridium sp.]